MPVDMNNKRVVIEGVTPQIDSGRFPIKRVVGDTVIVEADVFTDGHEAVSCELLFRSPGSEQWTVVPMKALVNDRWRAQFTVSELGSYTYTIEAWLDHFKLWSTNLVKRVEAKQDVSIELLIGAGYVEDALKRAAGPDATSLQSYLGVMTQPTRKGIEAALSPELAALMYRYASREGATAYDRALGVLVDRERAQYGAWYEFFPRSCWTPDCTQGTFQDCKSRLPYISRLGFDIIYLPPIHPIGHAHRKGKNNSTIALSGDVGSPWAIGSELGGHKSVNPDLGTLDDFHDFMDAARQYGIEIALDIAFQCSPDHPYVKEHPEWFRKRPDGTIQYAENPPKKYEDIYPFDFDTSHWREMWAELKSVIDYWIEQGVKIFRVDNPHTKALRFWEWLIHSVRESHPDVIFLAEAFTRPKVMYFLAKIGFTQSYNYFAWRNTKQELTEYFTELTKTEICEFFRPNLWPNTPDILPEMLQVGGRPAFMSRFVLAATLGASYGIYGPAYEQCVNVPMGPGKEEYIDSEKYEIKHWDVERPGSLAGLIGAVNRIRKENPALHTNDNLHFHDTSNDWIVAYSKATDDQDNIILTVVNLDPDHKQAAVIDLDLDDLGVDAQQPYAAHDLLSDNRYMWSGKQTYVELDPALVPAHIFRINKRVRTEKDFDYYT
jgi:starch synthase (maltosyl-transferring)